MQNNFPLKLSVDLSTKKLSSHTVVTTKHAFLYDRSPPPRASTAAENAAAAYFAARRANGKNASDRSDWDGNKITSSASLRTHTDAGAVLVVVLQTLTESVEESRDLSGSFYVSISAFWCLTFSLRWSRWQDSTLFSWWLPLAWRLWWLIASFSDPCLRFVDQILASDSFSAITWTSQTQRIHLIRK